MTTVEITRHNGGNPVSVGTLEIAADMSDAEIGAVANESGGMSDLVGMADTSTVPDDYEWTGDECYAVS